MRDKITLYSLDRSTQIDLPAGYTYAVSETPTGQSIEMADGSIVYEQYGLRRVVELTAGYIPDTDYARLIALCRSNPFVYAIYMDTNGSEVGAEFRLEIGARELFSISSSGALWKGAKITLTAREAISSG